jgi:hypothetical protein
MGIRSPSAELEAAGRVWLGKVTAGLNGDRSPLTAEQVDRMIELAGRSSWWLRQDDAE